MFTEPPVVEDTPRTYRSDISTARIAFQKTTEAEKPLLTAQDTLEAINKAFTFFRKAIVSLPASPYAIYKTLSWSWHQIMS